MKNKHTKYFLYGLLAVIIGSANATVIKYTSADINPIAFNTLRYALASIVTFPFFIRFSHKITYKNLRYSFLSGFCLFFATICYVSAINLSQATYVTLLTLLNPVMLVILTLRLTRDKVNKKHIAGFSLAGLGALLVVVGPMILHGSTNLNFYPWATLFVLVNVISYPLGIIFARKANESRKKLPLVSTVFIQTTVIATLSYLTSIIINHQVVLPDITSEMNYSVLYGIIYSGIGVGILDRILGVKSYEKIGSAIMGGLVYLGTFLSLIIAVIALEESLSLIAVIGGVIILLGVYLSEHRLPKHHKHHLFLHRH